MRKILLAAFIMLLTVAANAQTDSVRLELDHIFQNIDKTQIPTGFLNEYGPGGGEQEMDYRNIIRQ